MSERIVKKGALLGLYAQTSLHPGSGTALGTVDLPVQRERYTSWPLIAGTALKGVLRDACRERLAQDSGKERADLDKSDQRLVAAFGPPTDEADKHAGALSITDARLLAFPVRSLKGVFAWVTCPEVLDRLARDAALAGIPFSPEIPQPPEGGAVVAEDCPHVLEGGYLVLEEFDFKKADQRGADQVAGWIGEHLMPLAPSYAKSRERFIKSLVILHSDDFTHFARYATEVTARIRLDYDTKTVSHGALFYQEFLPPESLFYSVIIANSARSRGANGLDAAGVMSVLEETLPDVLQVGGDETTGKGYCVPRLAVTEG